MEQRQHKRLFQQMFNIPHSDWPSMQGMKYQGSYDEIAPQTIGNNIVCKRNVSNKNEMKEHKNMNLTCLVNTF